MATDQWKRTVHDYVHSAAILLYSMSINGFDPDHVIPIDPDGELLGGAHRLACTLALGIDTVPVKPHEQRIWAPAWGRDWFVDNGMAEDDLIRLDVDWKALND